MPLNTQLLAKLGPNFGAIPELGFSEESAARPLNELALSSGPDRKFTKAEEDILRLLSDGHSQETVATTLGITPSQISQYLSKEGFREELSARKSKKLEKYKKLDDGYDRIEQVVIDKLEASLAFVSKPLELTAILSKINAAKRRMNDPSSHSNVPVQQVVQIVLPTAIIHQFTKSSEGHVLAVDDQSLVTMPSNVLSGISKVPQLENK